jgi:N utilization substance protein B
VEEHKERKFRGGLRSVSRFCAVQMLYQAAITGTGLSRIASESKKRLEAVLSEDISVSDMDAEFFQLLLETVEKHWEQLDEAVSMNLSSNWRIDRLDSVMRAILRLGAAELLHLKDIPANVIFNEYIEISKSFFGKSDVAFVNGLLNSIMRQNSRDSIEGK